MRLDCARAIARLRPVSATPLTARAFFHWTAGQRTAYRRISRTAAGESSEVSSVVQARPYSGDSRVQLTT